MRVQQFAAVFTLLSAGVAAHADTFHFSFGTASSMFSGSGTLTTGALEAPQEYPISAVTGTALTSPNGASLAITSILAPGTFPTIANGGQFPPNDNTLFVINNAGSLSQDGLSFLLSDGSQINLYNDGPGLDALLERAGGAEVFESAAITITPTATPEPSTFALFGTGLLGIAGALKRRTMAGKRN